MKKRYLLIGLITILFIFAGCDEGEKEDFSISEVTIINIPKKILVADSDPERFNNTFKVYLNASDTQSENDDPVAQGVEKIINNPNVTDNGDTYTIKMKLYKPILDRDDPYYQDPNQNAGEWKGTARYFSIMISPEDTSENGVNAIWAKASMSPLNKDRKQINWGSLIDMRGTILGIDLESKAIALYDGIICKDTDIISASE